MPGRGPGNQKQSLREIAGEWLGDSRATWVPFSLACVHLPPLPCRMAVTPKHQHQPDQPGQRAGADTVPCSHPQCSHRDSHSDEARILDFPQKKNSRQASVRQGWGFLRETLIVLIISIEGRTALWERTTHTRCRRGLLKREPYLSNFRAAMCAVSVAFSAASQRPFLPLLSGE